MKKKIMKKNEPMSIWAHWHCIKQRSDFFDFSLLFFQFSFSGCEKKHELTDFQGENFYWIFIPLSDTQVFQIVFKYIHPKILRFPYVFSFKFIRYFHLLFFPWLLRYRCLRFRSHFYEFSTSKAFLFNSSN